MDKFRCTVCNWVFSEQKEGNLFESLSESFTCPICGAPKSAFIPEGVHKQNPQIKTNVADKIVDQLEALGVRFIYGIPGDSNLPIIEAIRKSKKIKFILTRHEETAAFMACAHGKLTGTLGVCISIAGPGCTNLITGLMDAQMDRSPVLALVGQIPEVYLGSEAFQEIDQIEMFRPFTEYAETIARSNQALKLVINAAKFALRKPGVSVLSTPTDILAEKLATPLFSPDKRLFQRSCLAEDAEIQSGADLINKHRNVVILAGWGARLSGKLVEKLAEKIASPVATTSRAKGIIDESLPLSVGVLGSIGSKHAAQAIQHCDLIVIVGSGFRQANLVPAGIKTMQVDIDPTRIGRTFDIEIGLVGDASLILSKLIPLVKERERDVQFHESVEQKKREHLRELEEDGNDFSTPIHPGLVIQLIKKYAQKDAIFCVDVGDHTYWFYKKFICQGQRTLMSANIASMGFALPASLAAQLQYPQKQVVCVSGDGGFAMLMADFTTAVREKLPIKVVLFNDGKLKNIMKEQHRDTYPEFGISFPNPDFALFAQSCGGEGYRVEDPQQLGSVIQKAFSSANPALIDVIVDSQKVAHSTKRVI